MKWRRFTKRNPPQVGQRIRMHERHGLRWRYYFGKIVEVLPAGVRVRWGPDLWVPVRDTVPLSDLRVFRS